jgi:WD40 repeat protein
VEQVARFVCQVVPRTDRVTFIWSEGAAFFEPYHLAGDEKKQLESVSLDARRALAQAAVSAPSPELAQLGHQLYRAIFRAGVQGGQDAQEIARWLQEQLAQGRVDSIEFLGPAAGQIPWNLLLESPPAAGAGVSWESFWGSRLNIAAGRRTNPLRSEAPLVTPSVLLAADAGFLAELSAEARGRIEGWSGDRLVVEAADDLANHLRRETPDILVLLCRIETAAMRLGSQRVTPAQLRHWIGEAREGNPDPVVFIGGAGTTEQTPAWVCWLAAATAALDGLVTNEVPVGVDAATQAALAFTERFAGAHRPLAAALADIRRSLGATGAALTAFCPPGLCTTDDEAAEAAAPVPTQPLPDYPYCPLRPYGPDERPLFFGREEELLRLAELLDESGATGVILHGEASVGKTSLVEAGLWPYLEQECVGYRVLRDRTPEGTAVAEDDYPPVVLRPGRDLAGQLADGLLAFCAQPLTYTTPTEKVVSVDLPALLAAHLAGTGVGLISTAISEQPLQGLPSEPAATAIAEPGHAPPPEPEAEPGAGARDLWLALREDPARLGQLLDEVTRRLPFDLVLTIDQAEELLTLTQSATEQERRGQALEMLAKLADSAARCKVLLVLRTEYFGQLAGLFPHGGSRAGWKEFFLDELDQAGMMDAVLGPTSRETVLYSDEVPHEKYRFAYEDGLAQQIVDEVTAEARSQGHGRLPLLQAVCAMLYDRWVQHKREGVIRAVHLRDIGPFKGALARFVAQKVSQLPLPGSARGSLRRLMRQLCTLHTDGRVTRDLVAARELKETWTDRTPVEQAVNAAADQAGLFSIDELLVAGEHRLYVSLGAGAVADAARQWDAELRGTAASRKTVIDTLWIMIPLALLAAAVSFAGTYWYVNDSWKREVTDFVAKKQQENEDLKAAVQEHLLTLRSSAYRAQLAVADNALAAGSALGARQVLLSEPAVATSLKGDIRSFEWDYLWNRVNGERHSLEGHLGTVAAVSVSADGRLAASASADGTVRLWHVPRGQAAALVPAGKSPLHAVALSPDGKTVAAAGSGKVIHVWDVSAVKDDFVTLDQEPRSFRGHDDTVLALAFDKDGQTLASAGADKTVILWDVKSGQSRAKLQDHGARIQALAFSADGKLLASGAAEAGAILWAADTGKKTQSVATRFQSVTALAFAPDGKTLAIGGTLRQAGVEVGALNFWPLKADGQTSEPSPLSIHHGRDLLALAYFPGGKAIATAGKDAVIRLWDTATGREAAHWVGHLGWVTSLAFTHDAGTLVSAGYDRSVKTWDVGQTKGVQVLSGHKDWVQCLALAGKEKILVSGGKDGLVKLWDAATGDPLGELPGHKGAVTAVALAAHKPLLLAVGTWSDKDEGEIKLWQLSRDDKGGGVKGKELQTLKGHKGGITCLGFNPKKAQLASGSADKSAILWDAETGKPEHTLGGHLGEVRCITYSSDGQFIFTSGTEKVLRAWSTVKGQLAAEPTQAHSDTIEAVDYQPLPGKGGGTAHGVITAGLDQFIRLWGAGGEGKLLMLGEQRAANHPITSVVRRDMALFTGGWDNTVRAWSLAPRKIGETLGFEFQERFIFTGHAGPVRAVVIAPDISFLASAGHDGTIRIWRGLSTRPAVAPKGKE